MQGKWKVGRDAFLVGRLNTEFSAANQGVGSDEAVKKSLTEPPWNLWDTES